MERQYSQHKVNYTLPIIGIDLGCGFLRYKEKDGYIGIDIIDYGQEIVWDVTQGIPLPDNSVPQVFTCHFMEHVKWEDTFEIFRELWRVCVNGAEIFIRMPYPDPSNLWALYASHMGVWDDQVMEHFIVALNFENNKIKFNFVSNAKVGDELQTKVIVEKE